MPNKFHDISITICPKCGFKYRTSSLDWRRRKRKCPDCGYKFPIPDITPEKFDPKRF